MSAQVNALHTGRIYPGLRPFEPEDAVLFFGREEQTDELLRRLEDTRFLAVVGLSGSGKSSLVRAGLLPALHRGHLAGGVSRWRVCVMRPGGDPLGALERVLNEQLGTRDDRLSTLRSGSLGLMDASRQGRAPQDNLLLVVDQFEEIFRLQDAKREQTPQSIEFVELLLAATRDYESAYPIYVVITLRSDYLGECARFRGLPEVLNDSQYLVPRMTREQQREAIEGPAALGGLGLTGDLLDELLTKTGDDPDQLPVLQHLLMRMWEIRKDCGTGSHIDLQEYEAVGGWDDALNRHADAVWEALEERRDLAKRVLQRLTEKAQAGREIRRPASIRELAVVADVPTDQLKSVIEHFRQEGRSFLTSPDPDLTDDSVIDISHESLIRRWKRLNEWATEEAGWGEWYRRIEDRIRIGISHLADPELEAALQARAKGQWNQAWARRYAADSDGRRLSFERVTIFLEESKARRRTELARLRRTRAFISIAAIVFAIIAVAAIYFWSSARAARNQAQISASAGAARADEAEHERQKAAKAALALEQEGERTKFALQEATRMRDVADQNLAEARQQRNQALVRQLASDSVSWFTSSSNPTLAALLGIESLRRAETLQGYGALWNADVRLRREVARLKLQWSVCAVTFSQDGTMLAIGAYDKTARVLDVRTGMEIARLEHGDTVKAVAFSPDGKLVATGSWDSTARVYAARTGLEVARLLHQKQVSAVAFSPDGKLVATGSDDSTARLFEAVTGREVARLVHQEAVHAVAFSPDGKLVATASYDHTARVFEVTTGREVTRVAHQDRVVALSFSPDGKWLATGSADKTARVSNAFTGREVARLAHQGLVASVAFSPNGYLVATASEDKTARVFLAQTGAEVARLLHRDSVHHLAFSPDGELVATGADDYTARVFEASSGREVARLAHHGYVYAVAFSPNGQLLATGSEDKTARVFKVHTGQELPRLGHRDAVRAVALSPDGARAATGSDDQTARIFDVATGRALSRVRHQKTVDAVAFSPDANVVATGAYDGTVQVFEARTGRRLLRPLVHPAAVRALAFSPDGRLIASGADDWMARVFDARTGQQVGRAKYGRSVYVVAFSPDGKLLATCTSDDTMQMSQVPTSGREPRLLYQNKGKITAVAFSPDGTLITIGGWDGARVSDALTGREVARLPQNGSVHAVAFSPEGDLVATGAWNHNSNEHHAHVFEVRTGREIATLPIGEKIRQLAFSSNGRVLRVVSGEMDLRITEDLIRPPDLISDACSKLDRNLTAEEWSTYLSSVPYRKTCEQLGFENRHSR